MEFGDFRYLAEKQYESPTVGPISARIVALFGFAVREDDGSINSGVARYPVVAVRSMVVHDYSRRVPRNDHSWRTGRTHAELIECGWIYDGNHLETDLLVLNWESGLLATVEEEYRDYSCHLCQETVVCEWDPADDATRLAPTGAALQKKAVEILLVDEAHAKKAAAKEAAAAGGEVPT